LRMSLTLKRKFIQQNMNFNSYEYVKIS